VYHDLTFAIGDVHGCLDQLVALLDACDDYAAGRTYRVVLLGDYIDRGPDSAGVVKLLRGAQESDPDDMICLKGNHEDMIVRAAGGAVTDIKLWYDNGGFDTLTSYGLDDVIDLPADDIDWMRRLPLFVDDGMRFFVHAGIDPAAALTEQDAWHMMWTRASWPEGFNPGRLIVHGHTPQREPKVTEHAINIDTAAAYGNALTSAVFDDEQVGPLAFITHDGHVDELWPPAATI
jgi:serine/threonine protein phosphatase 1